MGPRDTLPLVVVVAVVAIIDFQCRLLLLFLLICFRACSCLLFLAPLLVATALHPFWHFILRQAAPWVISKNFTNNQGAVCPVHRLPGQAETQEGGRWHACQMPTGVLPGHSPPCAAVCTWSGPGFAPTHPAVPLWTTNGQLRTLPLTQPTLGRTWRPPTWSSVAGRQCHHHRDAWQPCYLASFASFYLSRTTIFLRPQPNVSCRVSACHPSSAPPKSAPP